MYVPVTLSDLERRGARGQVIFGRFSIITPVPLDLNKLDEVTRGEDQPEPRLKGLSPALHNTGFPSIYTYSL